MKTYKLQDQELSSFWNTVGLTADPILKTHMDSPQTPLENYKGRPVPGNNLGRKPKTGFSRPIGRVHEMNLKRLMSSTRG